jgi:hypothetical protein
MHDDEGRALVVHYDNSLVPGDRFAGMPGNPHFLGPDRRHHSTIPRSRTEPYGSVRLRSFAVLRHTSRYGDLAVAGMRGGRIREHPDRLGGGGSPLWVNPSALDTGPGP